MCVCIDYIIQKTKYRLNTDRTEYTRSNQKREISNQLRRRRLIAQSSCAHCVRISHAARLLQLFDVLQNEIAQGCVRDVNLVVDHDHVKIAGLNRTEQRTVTTSSPVDRLITCSPYSISATARCSRFLTISSDSVPRLRNRSSWTSSARSRVTAVTLRNQSHQHMHGWRFNEYESRVQIGLLQVLDAFDLDVQDANTTFVKHFSHGTFTARDIQLIVLASLFPHSPGAVHVARKLCVLDEFTILDRIEHCVTRRKVIIYHTHRHTHTPTISCDANYR